MTWSRCQVGRRNERLGRCGSSKVITGGGDCMVAPGEPGARATGDKDCQLGTGVDVDGTDGDGVV